MAQRSAIKRVQEHDSSAAFPMTLCVFKIHPPKGENQPACLELTDGWYRIYASIDETLYDATIRGRLKVGHKLNISGARVSAFECPRVLRAHTHMPVALHRSSTAQEMAQMCSKHSTPQLCSYTATAAHWLSGIRALGSASRHLSRHCERSALQADQRHACASSSRESSLWATSIRILKDKGRRANKSPQGWRPHGMQLKKRKLQANGSEIGRNGGSSSSTSSRKSLDRLISFASCFWPLSAP